MRDTFRLSVIVGKAALIVTTGCFALVLASRMLGFKPDIKPIQGEILGVVACFIPIAGATAWISRKLRAVYPRREARALSIAFGIFTPISLAVSFVLAEITGGYAEILAGPKFFGLIGAFIGVALMTAFLSFLVCSVVLRITRLAQSIEQSD
jgi:hypothetical protein